MHSENVIEKRNKMIIYHIAKYRIHILFIVIINLVCTPLQLSQRINKDRNSDIKAEFNIISKATKTYVDSNVRDYGIDSVISKYTNDAWYYLKRGDFGYAISRFNRILYIDSLNHNPYWGYGIILLSRCKIDSSLWYLCKAVKCDSGNIHLKYDLKYSEAVKLSESIDLIEKNKGLKKIIMEYQNIQHDFDYYPELRIQYIEILATIGDSVNYKKHFEIAKQKGMDLANATKIINHLRSGGTLYSYICNKNMKE